MKRATRNRSWGPVRALGACLLLTGGCLVPRADYDRVVERGNQLEQTLSLREQQLATLEREFRDLSDLMERSSLSAESLMSERIELLEEIEDMRQSFDGVRRDLDAERQLRAEQETEIRDLSGSYGRLVEELEAEIAAGQIAIHNLRGHLQVRALDQILFGSGSTEIQPQGREVLGKVAREVVRIPGHRVVVEGHTDDVPIATQCFPSNWELSCARASSVVRFLVEQGLPPERTSARGVGLYAPIAGNSDAPGRASNRRIEIVLVPEPPPDLE